MPKPLTYEDLPCPSLDAGETHKMETARAGSRDGEPVYVNRCRACGKTSGALNDDARKRGLLSS